MIYLGTTLVYFTIEVNKDLPRLFNYCFAVSCVMLFLGFASVLRGVLWSAFRCSEVVPTHITAS